ncbi:amidohydrolase family protein [Adhaeribacter rhizoryzae]|uniref:Amidohydrolase family protein n=1 Tax=Adhaeribacter rhizoryzae TaxID=2607907 RepID=A0A5M6D947_9BACT|nr:amidohydrolase family protein [Adhaeribacter rhizoryzae]KAA5541715.1 amidohydrolase family protein [Adhaeribacter rhizoryzae]
MSELKTITRREFLAGGSLLLAGTALKLNATPLLQSVPKEPIIDMHQHTSYLGRTAAQLLAHQRTMGITTTILLPAGHPVNYGSTHYGVSNGLQAQVTPNEASNQMAQQYPREFLFGANEVPDVANAIQEIEKYLKLGAPVIGELKFNIDCDAPEMQKIYELAEAYEVPVVMHWQYKMFNWGFDRFHKMLEKYPRVNFIGHAQTWWANIDKNHTDQNMLYPKTKVTPGGITDRLLQDYPNMFADMSAGSGLGAFTRDEEHARAFLQRHQDKLIYGSDCADIAGQGEACLGAQMIAAIRRLAPSKKIERKLLYENARTLFKIKV